ncbi:hypothetical protein LTR95_008970, partial [Oleoguttula sp. CCFEE 5521]
AGPSPGTVRAVGDASVPGKATRTKFTHADDVILWEWVMGAKRKGGSEKGLEIYKQLEGKHAQHTTQSWRDRWVKTLSGREKPAGAREVEEIEEQGGNGYDLGEPQRRKTLAAIDDNDQDSSATPGSRQPFTKEDDRVLKEWVMERAKLGELVKGNKIYRALAEQNPRHTAQSWRDRYVKYLANKAEPDTVATPTKGRVTFTEEDDLILWNWVVTCKAQSSKCWVKGTVIYKELAKSNKRHPWRAWRDRYLRLLRAHPPAGGSEETDPVSDDEGAILTKTQFDELLSNGKDIENIVEDQVEDAWDAWAEVYTTHSAEVWRRLYEEHVRPVYLKTVIDQEARATTASKEPPRSSPIRAAHTPDRVTERSNLNSPGTRKRKRATPTSSQRRTYGQKRAKGDGPDTLSEHRFIHSPARAVSTPEILARAAALPANILQQHDEAVQIGSPKSAQRLADGTEVLIHQDHLPTSEANRAAEQQLLAQSNHVRIDRGVTSKDYLPTSEANHAAEQQLLAKSGLFVPDAPPEDMEIDAASDNRPIAHGTDEVERTPARKVTTPTRETNSPNPNAPFGDESEEAESVYSTSTAFERAAAFELDDDGNILDKDAEARMYMSDAESAQDEAGIARRAEETHAQQRFDEEVLGYEQADNNAQDKVLPPPIRALTAANLADFESQITPTQLRATDLAEDANDADQTNFANYLHSLLPVQPDVGADGDVGIPDRLMDTPEEEEADAIELQSDRKLSPDDSGDEEAEAIGVNIEDVFSQNLDWPSSPVKFRRVESSPMRQESQGWGFETQLAYPDLAKEALEAAREEAGVIASQVADVVTAPFARQFHAEPQLRSPAKPLRSTTPLHEPQSAVENLTPVQQSPQPAQPAELRTQPLASQRTGPYQINGSSDWSREEDTAITDAMQRSSRAADTLAELKLPGRSLPAIRRRSAVLLQQRPSLMGGWDEDDEHVEDEADASATAPAVPDHVAEISRPASLPGKQDAGSSHGRVDLASAVQAHSAGDYIEESETSEDDSQAEGSDNEIDLTIPEPEGGFDMFSSQQEMPLSSPRRKIECPDIPRETIAQQQAEVMEISSASSSSDSSDDDELDQQQPKPLPISQQSLRMLNTQAVLDAETQAFDLSMPLPPDSDEEDDTLVAQDLPVQAVQVPASSTLPSTKPQLSSAAPIKFTPAPRPLPSSNPKPRSSLLFTKPFAPTNRPPIPADETLPSFLHRLTQLSYTQPAILSAIHRTSMRFDLAQALLISERYKRPLSDSDMRKGIWTAEEDQAVFGGSSGGLRRLTEKFGWDEVERRMQFLEEWENA